MEQLINVFTFISIPFIISINLATYLIILAISKKKNIKSGYKKLITAVVGVGMWFVYNKFKLVTIEAAIPSFLLAIIIYDYLIKDLLSKFNISNTKKDA